MSLNELLVKANETEAKVDKLAAQKKDMHTLYMKDGHLDPTEREALERMDGKLDKLRTIIKGLRDKVEANKAIWDSRSGDLAEIRRKLLALKAFRHKDFNTIDSELKPIPAAESDQRWADATAILDQGEVNMAPAWEDYETQMKAKAEYDPLRTDLEGRLETVRVAEPRIEKVTTGIGQCETDLDSIDADIDRRSYVDALKGINAALKTLEAVEAEVAELHRLISEYDGELAKIQPKLTEVSVSEFPTMLEAQQKLVDLQGEMEALATKHDYEAALEKLKDVSAQLDTVHAEQTRLRGLKDTYETGLAKISNRLAATRTSELASTAEVQQKMVDLETGMTEAAGQDQFEEAIKLQGELEKALVAYEATIDDRDLYEARLAAIQQQLLDASVSDPTLAYLDAITADLATIQTEMEKAAAAENFGVALDLIGKLEAKLVDRDKAIAVKKAEYLVARALVILDMLPVAMNPYKTTEPDAKAVSDALKVVDDLAKQEDWAGGLKAIEEVKAKIKAYEAARKTYETKLRGEIAPLLSAAKKSLKDSAAATSAIKTSLTKLIAKIESALKTDGANLETARDDAKEAKLQGEELEKVFEIRTAINAAATGKNDDKALELYNKYKGDMASLPQEARNLLVENLMDDEGSASVSAAEHAAIKDIWRVPSIDRQFAKLDGGRRKEMIDKYLNDPKVKQYAADWSTMSKEDKEKAIEYVAAIPANAWGVDVIPPENVSVYEDSTSSTRGSYSPGKDTLEVNLDGGNMTTFTQVLMTITHEVGHKYQEDIEAKYVKNKGDPTKGLKPGSPEYEQAKAFYLDDKYQNTYKDEFKANSNEAYFRSPDEVHSRVTANEINDAVKGVYGAGKEQKTKTTIHGH